MIFKHHFDILDVCACAKKKEGFVRKNTAKDSIMKQDFFLVVASSTEYLIDIVLYFILYLLHPCLLFFLFRFILVRWKQTTNLETLFLPFLSYWIFFWELYVPGMLKRNFESCFEDATFGKWSRRQRILNALSFKFYGINRSCFVRET